ncbi:hypothetical protein MD484_g8509, partial [Candolleomyces efflorescens]
MHSSIEGLPNELLHYVLSCLPPNKLNSYCLAFTCKRLYTAILPVMLAAYACQLREATAFETLTISSRAIDSTPSGSRALSFEQVAQEQYAELFESTSHLKVELRLRYTITSSFRDTHIWSICALLAQKIALRLIIIEFTSEAGELIADRRAKQVKHHPQFFRAFASLLRACISHEGVKIELRSPLRMRDAKYSPFSHEVVHSAPVLQMPTLPQYPIPSPPPTSLLHRILSFVEAKWKGRKFQAHCAVVNEYSPPPSLNSKRVDVTYPIPTAPLNTEGRVSCLLVAGASTFCPPLYMLLETHLLIPSQSSLTSLSLTESKMTHYDWHAILQLPAWQGFSRLEHLDVWDSQIAFPDLLKFLERHPTIVDLNLSRYTAIGKVQIPDGRGILPNLKTLNATPEFLIPLLNHQQKSQAHCPLLDTLRITQASSAFYIGPRDPLGTKNPLTDSTNVLKTLLEGRHSWTKTREGIAPSAKGRKSEAVGGTCPTMTISLYLVSEPPPGFKDCLRYALNLTPQSECNPDFGGDSDAENLLDCTPYIAREVPPSIQSLCEVVHALTHDDGTVTSIEIFSSYQNATQPELIIRVPSV